MKQNIIRLAGFLLLIVFLVGSVAFTTRETEDVICRSIKIDFDEDETIRVEKEEILRIIKSTDQQLLSEDFRSINTENIEIEIEKHEAILNAEVYEKITRDSSAYKGVLVVNVEHREPVVRIMSFVGSYYLDRLGGKIPISSNYTANVLTATGYFGEDYARNELLPFIIYVENDEFWKAQIEQVHVEKDGNVLLTPLIGEHVIELGRLDDFQEKLGKMKVFYTQVLVKNNWNRYRSINLKYNNQVIAKKR